MASLTFYGGIREIGGNQILLEDADTRIFLDFGMSFSQKNAFYDEFLQPRTNACLRDQLKLGFIPDLDGLYRQDLIKIEGIDKSTKEYKCPEYWSCDIKSYKDYVKEKGKPFIDCVLLTHAHADHFQYISFLDPEIPVYCSPETKVMLKAIQDVSKSSIEQEICTVKERGLTTTGESSFFPNETKISTVATQERDIVAKKPLEEFKVGSLKITPIPVDHSVPGAYAFYIKTKDKKILYTGDLRFHGRLKERSEQFTEFLKNNPVDVLLVEGTRIEKESKDDEFQVEADIKSMIEKSPGLVIIDFGWKDTTRFETIQKVAEETGRMLVVNPKLAYLLHYLSKELPDHFKPIESYDNVRCYVKRRENMTYADGDCKKFKHNAGYILDWDKKLMKTDEDYKTSLITHLRNGVKAYEIRKNPGNYIIMLSFFDMNELFDIEPPEGSKYICAHCEPFNDEMLSDQNKLKQWLDKFNLLETSEQDLDHFHASGHASRNEIKELVEQINPKIIYPIHTLKPDEFLKFHKNVIWDIKLGEKYEI